MLCGVVVLDELEVDAGSFNGGNDAFVLVLQTTA
jgi:hypothetical protein